MDEKGEPLSEEDALKKMALELIDYAEEMLSADDYKRKIEILAEVFSEGLLGLLKTYILLNPNVDPTRLCDAMAEEFKSKLCPWFQKDEHGKPKLIN